MGTEKIQILRKTKIANSLKTEEEVSGCCGGAPVSNEDDCCKLDEDKKAEGESGCGCNTSSTKKKNSGCC